MRIQQACALAFAAVIALPLSAFAQATASVKPAAVAVTITEETPGLKAKAKVSTTAAMAAARKEAPKGSTFSKGSMREEDGKLIYSLQFVVGAKSEIKEINVDAMTGSIVVGEEDEGKDAARKPEC